MQVGVASCGAYCGKILSETKAVNSDAFDKIAYVIKSDSIFDDGMGWCLGLYFHGFL
jgi:hypothetical protein